MKRPADYLRAVPKMVAQSRAMFRNNRAEIREVNGAMCRRISLCLLSVMLLLIAFGLAFQSFQSILGVYFLSAGFSLVCYLLSVLALPRVPRASLPLLYLLVLGQFVMCVYLSTRVSPDTPAITFIAYLLLVPIVMLDRGLRVDIAMVLSNVVFCVFSHGNKTYDLFVDDVVICSAMMALGIIVGAYMRGIRLDNIDARRLLVSQRNTDSLTGLPNRRVLFEHLAAHEAPDAQMRYTGVMMVDIDRFKAYNDLLGHQAGDACIRRIGHFFSDFANDNGITFYRYGGEEFLGLDAVRDTHALGVLANRLQMGIRALAIPFPGAEEGIVTVSVGCAHRERHSTSGFEQIISAADLALYAAKERGRARVVNAWDCDLDALEKPESYQPSLRARK